MQLILLVLLLIPILWIIGLASQKEIRSHWHYHFDNFNYSTETFYNSVSAGITKRQVPEHRVLRVTHSEAGLLSANRVYLRVYRNEFFIDICAAPFGTGYFVSWWLVETPGFLKALARKFPFLAALTELKTYFQIDTEIMFRQAVHLSVLDAIDAMTADKGIRLTEAERQVFEDKRK